MRCTDSLAVMCFSPAPGIPPELGNYTIFRYDRGLQDQRTTSRAVTDALADWVGETFSKFLVEAAPASPLPVLPESVSSLICTRLRDISEQGSRLNHEIARCLGIADTQNLIRHGTVDGLRVSVRIPVPDMGRDTGPFGCDFTVQEDVKDLRVLMPDRVSLGLDSRATELSDQSYAQALDWVAYEARNTETEDQRRYFTNSLITEVAAFLGFQYFRPLTRMCHYLPAARTGVMDSYLAVVGSLIDQTSQSTFPRTVSHPSLTGIVSDFLVRLTSLDEVRWVDPSGNLTKNIEKSILGGEVRMDRSAVGFPEFLYRPDGWDHDLRLMNTSSMVSELAPVVLYLRHIVRPGEVLIIEEPEAHLHPAMQVEFVRHLAAAVRAGIRIVITTHSEWVLEELANLVHLSNLPDSQREGIEGADYALTPDQLGVWLFESNEQPMGSVIQEIPFDSDNGGFVSDYEDVAISTHNDWARITNRLSEPDAE